MTHLSETVQEVRSGVFQVVFLDDARRRISSGTSFISNGCLITNGHVLYVPPRTSYIYLQQEGHLGRFQGLTLTPEEFENRRIVASPASEYDYAALDIPELIRLRPYQFKLIDHSTKRVGDPIAFLGYHFEHANLTCHAGVISSFYLRNLVHVIQIDASVNPSNSGGPVFDPANGEVFGIVTRKATGLTRAFEAVKKNNDDHAELIKRLLAIAEKNKTITTVTLQAMSQMGLANQQYLKYLMDELERSANVGIGYAFSCRHVLEEREFLDWTSPRRVEG